MGVASGSTIPDTMTAVLILDNGVGGRATATLPNTVPNGTMIITTSNDPQGAQVNGVNQNRDQSLIWIMTSDGWKDNA